MAQYLKYLRKDPGLQSAPSGRTLKTFLPVFFMTAMLLSGCGSNLEKPYDINAGLMRMNSLNASSNSTIRAKSFAEDLAVPGTTDFNAEGITAPACLLVEYGKDQPEALAYKNPYVRTYQASITKVMTALVCLDQVQDLQKEFTVTQNSVMTEAGSSTAFLHPGETLTIEQLLYGMLIPSGNDAAVAVAEATAGSVDAFVQMMNKKALELGATGTHFMNPHGLHNDDHYSTPYDIYLILNAALQYDEFRKIVGSTSYAVQYKDSNGMPKSQVWKGSNQFMTGERETPEGFEVLGGKTGTTKKAGYCLTMDTRKTTSGEEYISVMMKADSRTALYDNMTELLLKIH